jgi:hypothetical protein
MTDQGVIGIGTLTDQLGLSNHGLLCSPSVDRQDLANPQNHLDHFADEMDCAEGPDYKYQSKWCQVDMIDAQVPGVPAYEGSSA